MSTINLSFTSDQVSFIDQLMSKYGFSNRSEFFRSILRLVLYKPELVSKAAMFPFATPVERSVKTIVSDFKKTGKYSKAFLKDLQEGLTTSDYFQP